MSFLAVFLALVALWVLLTALIYFIATNPDLRRDYYEAKLDFMIWLAQSIMRSRHNGRV